MSSQDDEAPIDEDELEDAEDGVLESEVVSATDKKIEKEYEAGRLRVVQDRNDFILPHLVDFVTTKQWLNLNPEYQRRLRWNLEKKSRLIESFVMNVPVPAVFLYDAPGTKLEVLDGQQRINAAVEFLSGNFALEKLTIWPELNGRTFAKLPPAIKRGLNRAKLSAITLLIDTPTSAKKGVDMRAQVFDRLNTGGEKLNPQELRNCLYSGSFNKLIVRLAGLSLFTSAWGIPNRKDHTLSDGTYDETLRDNKLFSTMADCQIVLRYFAFREPGHVIGSTRSILDECMSRLRNPTQALIENMKSEFEQTLDTALKVFGNRAFRAAASSGKRGRLSRPLFDAEMIAIDRLRSQKDKLIENRAAIINAIDGLTTEGSDSYATIVGRPNTANAIKARINVVEAAMREAIA